MSFIRNLFGIGRVSLYAGTTIRAKRWAQVRHLDANAADSRAVINQNASDVLAIMRNQRDLNKGDKQ